MNSVIDEPVIKVVYETAKLVYLGHKEIISAVNELVQKDLMNSSSARGTIYNLAYMLRGERYKRTNNAATTTYFLEHIQKDFGLMAFDKALSALDQHISYYEQLTQSHMRTLRSILKKYRSIAKEAKIPDKEIPTEKELIDFETQYEEGHPKQITQQVRDRCGALIAKVRSHYRRDDGNLYCEACGWKRPNNNLRGDIVEIHHLHAVAAMPLEGIRLTFQDAIVRLLPLCPNCHRIAHSKSEGGTFTLDELKTLLKN